MYESKSSLPPRRNKNKQRWGQAPKSDRPESEGFFGDRSDRPKKFRDKPGSSNFSAKGSFRKDDRFAAKKFDDRNSGGKPFGGKKFGANKFRKEEFQEQNNDSLGPSSDFGAREEKRGFRKSKERSSFFPFPAGHRRFRKDRNESEGREERSGRDDRKSFEKRENRSEERYSERRDRRESRPGRPGRPERRESFRTLPSVAEFEPKLEVKAEPSPVLSTEAQEKIAKTKIVIPGKQPAAVPVASNSPFSQFDLPEEILEALERAEFSNATPIQAKSLPFSLAGRDVMGCAQTGTGKTAAFVLPMMKMLLEDNSAMALVLAPTRELAEQIVDTLRKLRTEDLSYTLLIGGSSFTEQVRSLRRRPRIIVATPGRLVDHIQQRTIDLRKVKFFVLDEADRMFDMGFAPQIQKVTAQISEERQTLLFSATFSKEVKQLALNSMKDPEEVFVGETSSVASGVEQEIIELLPDQKLPMLLDELNKREGSVLLFVGMKYKADRLAKSLRSYGHYVDSIHSDRTQGQRRTVLKNFRDQRIRVLVATDVAARGLDIPHVAHVINYDLPNDPEDYVHRLGRTARAGAIGKSLSFVTHEDANNWSRIARMLNIDGGKSASSKSGSSRGKRGGRRGGGRGGRPGGSKRFSGRR